MRSTSPNPSSVLLVADAPGAAPALSAAVAQRPRARFTLLVPAIAHGLHRVVDPEDQCCAEAERTIAALHPLLEAAAHAPIATLTGSHEPLAAIEDALNFGDFDEVVLATRSSRVARGVHLDLARKVEALSVAVSVPAPALVQHPDAADRL